MLRSEACQLLAEVAKEQGPSRSLCYIGAASLNPTPDELTLYENRKLDHKTHGGHRFRQAFTELLTSADPVDIKRYIHLFTPDYFKGRSQEIRSEYLNWLETQANNLEACSSYILVDAKRAADWGSTKSSIITTKGFIDVIGRGEGGILVKGEDIARLVKARTVEMVTAYLTEQNKPVQYSRGNLQAFRDYIGIMKSADADASNSATSETSQ